MVTHILHKKRSTAKLCPAQLFTCYMHACMCVCVVLTETRGQFVEVNFFLPCGFHDSNSDCKSQRLKKVVLLQAVNLTSFKIRK